ncbi:aldehyde dehydrogenase (NAD+) [Paraburkholderia sp. CI2]|uniref:aldehyde dehydrogenase family protein n=1 Tax=Paraburkholderia sp. CI2 TaxID=2723093 RepID=UPI0016116118|nr:aldehyde dehydrogenase family protein [Paraburkholderia sp. CI2]MBB5466760.1 aldehyde dehydrogenase (NAD+) [Paraburkholderia sp. CI2]
MNASDTSLNGSIALYSDFDKQYISGQSRYGNGNGEIRDLDPYTSAVLTEIPVASRSDVDDAFQAAHTAQVEWARTSAAERAGVLLRAATIMERRKEEIVGWLIRESGSTRIKATLEWQAVNAMMTQFAGYPYQAKGEILPADVPGKEHRVYRRPIGVVSVISPWNWPLHLTTRSIAPALALGNAVVVKPASETPVTGGLLLARLFEEAGLPPGLLNVVIGNSSEIGDHFVTHPLSPFVSFTGSTPVGRHVGSLAMTGPTLKRAALELGGNAPLVVLEDADLELAVHAAIVGKFLHQGQICVATNRIMVHRSIHDSFVEAFVARASALKVGNPNDADTVIGPVISQRQADALKRLLARGLEQGAKPVLGGQFNGLVLPPQVLTGVQPEHELALQESFGPIAPILTFNNEEEALEAVNGTEFGLSSAVFTRDLERGARIASQVEAGMTHINDFTANDYPNTPFGGEKNSGLGRFGGQWIIDEMTRTHWVSVQHAPRTYPF